MGKYRTIFLNNKVFMAIFIDALDFICFSRFPVLNTIFDFFVMVLMYLFLKNKSLTYLLGGELPFVGVPPLSNVDAMIPMTTIIAILDNTRIGDKLAKYLSATKR